MKDAHKWWITLILTVIAFWAAAFGLPQLAVQTRLALVIFLWAVSLWIVRPVPEYLTSIFAATALLFLHFPGSDVLSGFADPIWWMITFATFLAAAIIKTGLGKRIAYLLMDKMGTTLLGSLVATTMTSNILAPFTPSNTARGGIIYGICEGIAQAFGFKPGEKKGDHTLMLANMYINTVNTNAFLTAMGGNAIFVSLISKATGHQITWNEWFIAAFVPALPLMILLPFIVYKMFPSEVKTLPGGRAFVQENLAKMGPITMGEVKTLAIMLIILALWATELVHHIPSTVVAFLIPVFLLTPYVGPVKWKDIEKEIPWAMLLWLGFAMSLASVVNKTGGFKWLIQSLFVSSPWLSQVSFTVFMLVIILAIIFLHFLFSGMNAMGMIILPVIMELAKARGFDPFVVGFIGALAVSTGGFFLPFNSAPNLIFYGSGRYDVADQIKGAIPLALIIALELIFALYVWWPLIGLI